MASKLQLRKGVSILALLLMMQVMLHPFVHAMPLPGSSHTLQQPSEAQGGANQLHTACLLCGAGTGVEAGSGAAEENLVAPLLGDGPEIQAVSPRQPHARPSLGRAPPRV